MGDRRGGRGGGRRREGSLERGCGVACSSSFSCIHVDGGELNFSWFYGSVVQESAFYSSTGNCLGLQFFFLHYFSINLSTKHIHGTGFDVPVMDYFPASIHLFESTVQGSTSLCWTYLLTFTQHINYQPTKPIYQSFFNGVHSPTFSWVTQCPISLLNFLFVLYQQWSKRRPSSVSSGARVH